MSIELRKKIYKNLLQEIFGEALNSREELIGEIEEEYKRLNLLPLSRNLKYEGELIFIYRYGQLFHANKNKNFKEIFDKEQIYSGWKDVVLNTELPKLKETLAGYLNENARERLFGILRISSAPFILNLNDEKELVNVFSKLYLTVKYRDGMIGFMKKVLSIKRVTKVTKGGKKIEDLGPTITWKDESGSKAQLTHLEDFTDDGITEGSVCTTPQWIDDGRIISWRIQILFKVTEPDITSFAKSFRTYRVRALSDMKGTNPAEPKGILGAWTRYDEKVYGIKDKEEEDGKKGKEGE